MFGSITGEGKDQEGNKIFAKQDINILLLIACLKSKMMSCKAWNCGRLMKNFTIRKAVLVVAPKPFSSRTMVWMIIERKELMLEVNRSADRDSYLTKTR